MISHSQVIVAGGIFVVTYAMIMLEKIHRTVVALTGAAAIILFKVISQSKAVEYIDFNTIGLPE